MGMATLTPTEKDIAEAAEVLSDQTGFDVDTGITKTLISDAPTLLALATEWGWNDTEVRGNLLDALSRHLIGKPWPTNADTHIEIDQFVQDVKTAHDSHAGRA